MLITLLCNVQVNHCADSQTPWWNPPIISTETDGRLMRLKACIASCDWPSVSLFIHLCCNFIAIQSRNCDNVIATTTWKCSVLQSAANYSKTSCWKTEQTHGVSLVPFSVTSSASNDLIAVLWLVSRDTGRQPPVDYKLITRAVTTFNTK